MSQYLTTDEAAKQWLCPLARTFGDAKAKSGCRGKACSVWRWNPRLATDEGYASAIAREKKLLAQEHNDNLVEGQKPKTAESFHNKAVAAVTRNPEGFGIVRDQGCCGLGGPIT